MLAQEQGEAQKSAALISINTIWSLRLWSAHCACRHTQHTSTTSNNNNTYARGCNRRTHHHRIYLVLPCARFHGRLRSKVVHLVASHCEGCKERESEQVWPPLPLQDAPPTPHTTHTSQNTAQRASHQTLERAQCAAQTPEESHPVLPMCSLSNNPHTHTKDNNQ